MFQANKLYVCGHRGARGVKPENTMLGFRYAAENGIRILETDIRMSADRKLMLIHDDSLDRTTDKTGLVRELTFDQIRTANAGDGEKVPTLEELFEGTADFEDMIYNLELKDFAETEGEDFALESVDRVLDAVERYGLADRVIINSFSTHLLAHAHKKAPGRYAMHGFFPFYHMFGAEDPTEFLTNATVFNSTLGQDGKPVKNPDPIAPFEIYSSLAEKGVTPWLPSAVRDPAFVITLLGRGVRVITSDSPVALSRALGLIY